jgi:hypothetical protein
MNWAERRKLTYIAIVVVFFAVIAFAIFHKVTNVPTSCFDHKQNGDEVGVDCGGSCNIYCSNQLPDPVVEWVRVFPVTPGIVDAVAYIQNSNPNAGAANVSYDFKLYDSNNTVLAERAGTTYLGPAGQTAIAETLIHITGTVAVARFTFNDPLHWQKISPDFSQVVINTDVHSLAPYTYGTASATSIPTQTSTRLTTTLQNQSRYNYTNTDVIAIFYDAQGNAITASKIVVPRLAALQNRVAYFTWPYAIPNIARTQIITRFNPFTAQAL